MESVHSSARRLKDSKSLQLSEKRNSGKIDIYDSMPIYEEPSKEAFTDLNTPAVHREGTLSKKRSSICASTHQDKPRMSYSRTISDLKGVPKLNHKALNTLIQKAAKFEKETIPVIEQKMVNDASNNNTVAKLAHNFTNVTDFKKTFVRRSETLISPL